MKQDINTNSRHENPTHNIGKKSMKDEADEKAYKGNQKANKGGKKANKANKGAKKKSLDIDFASLQSKAADSSDSVAENQNAASNVNNANNVSLKKDKNERVQYYNVQSGNAKSKAQSDKKTEQKPEKHVTQSSGEILRFAREARNISQEDIAKWMKLDVRLIDALEKGDDSVLPETVYKIGYLRSYAKLVELSPDTVIGNQIKHNKAPQFEHKIKDKNIFDDVLNQLSQLFPGQWASSLKDNDLKRGTFLAISVISFIAIAWITASLFRSNPDSNSEQDLQNKINQETIESGVESLHSTSLKISTPALGAASGKSKTEPLAAKPKVSELVLNFSSDSWVDIRDASGERLVRRLGLAGMSKRVSGVAPFQVLIGYGPGVTITYNGKPYDFASYQGKRVARFIIAPEPESK